MIIFRYLLRETFQVVWLVIVVSLMLLMSDMLLQYMQLASSGAISLANVFTLLGLQIPVLGINMLPLAFFLSLLFALSRMYLNSEMVVLRSGGCSALRSYSYVFIISITVFILQFFLSYYSLGSLEASQLREMQSFQDNLSFSKVIPQTFQSFGDDGVFYVEEVSHNTPLNIFFFNNDAGSNSVLHAHAAHMENYNNARYIVFDNGVRQSFKTNGSSTDISYFTQHAVLLKRSAVTPTPVKFQSSKNLWALYHKNAVARAQLQWRLSLPISVLLLTAFACVLAPLKPRSSQYGVILAGILIYAAYMNLLLWAKSYMQKHPDQALNAWWVHAAMVALLIFIWLVKRRKNLLQ